MRVGILGGGQLARMLILAGKPLGLDFVVYTAEITATTANLAEHVVGELTDLEAIDQFCKQVDVVTFENENIPLDAVAVIEEKYTLHPGSHFLANAQDRVFEKQMFKKVGIPTNQYFAVNVSEDLTEAVEQLGLPMIVKSRRLGYDGKHQYVLQSQADVQALIAANEDTLDDTIAEQFIAFEREVSIIAARDQQGAIVTYDLCENVHEQGILRTTKNRPGDPLQEIAANYGQQLMAAYDYVGVLACEFFVKDGQLLANEVAPRVHNSGHWTLEGSVTSQFENHLRAICGLPLGSTESRCRCQMINCISRMPEQKAELLSAPDSHWHDYQKIPRPNRKVGHITICAADEPQLKLRTAPLLGYFL